MKENLERRQALTDIRPWEILVWHAPLPRRILERKRRLFACACCRSLWDSLRDVGRKAAEVSERYADGMADEEELRAAHVAVRSSWPRSWPEGGAWDGYPPEESIGTLAWPWRDERVWADGPGAEAARCIAAWVESVHVARRLAEAVKRASFLTEGAVGATGEEKCDELLRAWAHDLFEGYCFPVTLSPSWQSWNHATVVKLAQAIYDERAFDCLPILADALEDAGCTDELILGHCRGPRPHVRGCWVIDLLLGKG
jgi:hypothetical protein